MNVNIFQPNWEWVQPDNQTSAISHRKVPDPLADWGFFYRGSRVFGIRWALGRPGTSPDTSFAAQYAGGQWEDFFHRKLGTEPGYWCPHALLDARQYKFSSSADLVEASLAIQSDELPDTVVVLQRVGYRNATYRPERNIWIDCFGTVIVHKLADQGLILKLPEVRSLAGSCKIKGDPTSVWL